MTTPMQAMRDRALALNALGIAIIPLHPEATLVNGNMKTRKSPIISQDKPLVTPAAITAYWYDSRKDVPLIGVVSGYSKVPFIFLDLDVHGDTNGYVTLDNAGLEIPETTIRYTSESGKGEHLWFKVPAEALGLDLTARGGLKYNGNRLLGVDNRVGNGYLHFPDDAPIPTQEDIDNLPDAPEWIWETSIRDAVSEETTFEGKPSVWMDNLKNATEGPYAFGVEVALREVMSAVAQGKDISYDTMRDTQYALVREGAKGSTGSYQAIKFLESQYLRGQWNTSEFQTKWETALENAIRKFGVAEVEVEKTNADSKTKYFSQPTNGKSKPQFLAHTFATDKAEETALDGAGAFWSYENGVWVYNPDFHTKALTSEFTDGYQKNWETLVADHLKSILAMQGKVLKDEPSKELINVENGMYNWKTGELMPHDQKYMSTVQLGVSYDPSATCPNFDKWLSSTLPGDEQLGLEVLGYMLMSGNPMHIIPLLVGSGRNGKSTYLRIMQKMIGDKNYSALDLNSLANDKFAIIGLYGKLANICADLHQRHLSNSSNLKKLTGEDNVQGERKNQMSFQFKPWATLIFSTNELWSSSDTSDGYMERWLPVPFQQKFTAGKFDESVLFNELNGIFNKAMSALRALMAKGEFSTSDAQQELVKKFREDADPVQSWLSDEDYVQTAVPGSELLKTRKRNDLYKSYKAYRKGKAVLERNKFYESLENKGFTVYKKDGNNGFYGIAAYDINEFSGEPTNTLFDEVTNVVPSTGWSNYNNL
jgi:putative DNA primase/helicase